MQERVKRSNEYWRARFMEIERDIIHYYRTHPLVPPNGCFASSVAKRYARAMVRKSDSGRKDGR